MAEHPYKVPLLLASLHWPCREAGGSVAESLGASGPGVRAQGAGSP